MAHNNVSPQLLAGGTINPSTFVKVSTAADNTALASGANELVIGISQVGTRDAPIPSAPTMAAEATDQIQIWGLGDVCSLKAGTGGLTRGGYVKSGAAGVGVMAATTGTTVQNVGAIALENAAEGEFGRVQILIFPYLPAVA